MNVTGGVQRHPTHFDFFARAPLDTRNGRQARRCRLKHESARDARNGLNISGNGEKYLCLERPVFDTHAFFLFVGSLHTRVHKRWPNVVAKRAGRQGVTKGSAIPACAVSNCEIAHTAARASVRSEAGNPRSGADRSGATYVGTMAQDLLETHPTAVITGDDGFYRVNYDQIDVNMTRLA